MPIPFFKTDDKDKISYEDFQEEDIRLAKARAKMHGTTLEHELKQILKSRKSRMKEHYYVR